jgi:hypothetical protein
MLTNINYAIWFKVCRTIKLKYRLTTNAVMILNCAYIAQLVNNKGFTLRNLQRYASYYNSEKIKYYVQLLVREKYIVESGMYNSRVLYSLSEAGLSVMKEWQESYDYQLVLFCSKYGIEL